MKYESGQYKIILSYLRDINDWVMEGKIRSIQTKYGWIGFRGDRDVRDLKKAGLLEERRNGKYCEVKYKWRENELAPMKLPPPFKVKEKEPVGLF